MCHNKKKMDKKREKIKDVIFRKNGCKEDW